MEINIYTKIKIIYAVIHATLRFRKFFLFSNFHDFHNVQIGYTVYVYILYVSIYKYCIRPFFWASRCRITLSLSPKYHEIAVTVSLAISMDNSACFLASCNFHRITSSLFIIYHYIHQFC